MLTEEMILKVSKRYPALKKYAEKLGVVDKPVVKAGKEVDFQTLPVRSNPHLIKDIENPSVALCLEAVKANPEVIYYIKNPSESVCEAAILKNFNVIQHIKNPSE